MAKLMEQIVGHANVKQVLQETQTRDSVPPSFIFAGPSGVGKFQMALAWAQWLLCREQTVGACGRCPDCLQTANKTHSNLILIAPEKNTIKLEQTRELIRQLSLRQWQGRRVVVFNDAQLLNPHAANSILKVVEEPPEGTHFVFVTASHFSMISTLRSRSQRVQFQPLSPAELAQISGQSGWVLGSAQGRMDQLEKLTSEAMLEARELAVTLLPKLLNNEHWQKALEGFKPMAKDREQLGFVFGIWRQLIRDSFVVEESARIHRDFRSGAELEQLSSQSRLMFYDLLTSKEAALVGHADPSLTLESMLISVKELQALKLGA
jgi:DNA polymerase-3 subunit delta'